MTGFISRAASAAGYLCQLPSTFWEGVNNRARCYDAEEIPASNRYDVRYYLPSTGTLFKIVTINLALLNLAACAKFIGEATETCPSGADYRCAIVDETFKVFLITTSINAKLLHFRGLLNIPDLPR